MQQDKEIVQSWEAKLEEKGYLKKDMVHGLDRVVEVSGEKYRVVAELSVNVEGKNLIMLKLERPKSPLNLLERRTISIARIIDEDPFPFVILTNGEENLFINTIKNKSTSEFDMPTRDEALKILSEISSEKSFDLDREKRVFAAFESFWPNAGDSCSSCSIS